MIQLKKVEVRGKSEAGDFSGSLEFAGGLQVISAKNAYGKSLAVKGVTWCLGLDAMFGNAENDPIRLPEAVREDLELAGHKSRVLKSECAITLENEKGSRLEITRAIAGGDTRIVEVKETEPNGTPRVSKLVARRATMQDQYGGFQRFLFEWMAWPRLEVPTFRGQDAEIYLENLAPLFYIDQDEGWTNIQALQIARYGQLEISEIAVEYLLGAMDALKAHIARLKASQRAAELKESAKQIEAQLNDEMARHGWHVEWSSHGSVADIVKRWSKEKLRDVLQKEASVDLDARQVDLVKRINGLRIALTTEPLDLNNVNAPVEVSQKAIELKKQRHVLNQDLSTFNAQLKETRILLDSLEHRIQAARDLVRLKTTGVGRLDHLECPTCHRELNPEIFGLSSQSAETVEAHIEAMRSDRELIIRNQEALSANVKTAIASIAHVDSDLRDAEKALRTDTSAVGPVREQIANTAAELSAAERELDRVSEAAKEIEDLQASINRWIEDARSSVAAAEEFIDKTGIRDAFVVALRKYLVALGHSAVKEGTAKEVMLDEQYVPFMNGRRLRALGSASDQSRLVAAYSLALAATAQQVGGKHPGFVIMDEPLQQNPDKRHRDLFADFLTKELAQKSKFQTLVFTWLGDPEIAKLRKQGTVVLTPSGEHFLQLVKTTPAVVAPTVPPVPPASAGPKAG